MEEPIKPNVEDCCNSGCNPCIFDIYEKQLTIYKNHLLNGISVNSISQDNGISQLKYTEFTVVSNVEVCNLHNLITFRRITMDKNVSWKPGDHFLVKYTAGESSCTRAYTPFKLKNEQIGHQGFSIIVKKYDNGLVSTHLCNIKEGVSTWWRGPYGHYKLEPNKFQRIIMIAQGTGIAPFITIIDKILNNENDMTKVILLYCCKNYNTILFREELYTFKSYWNFKYDIFLDGITTANFKCKYQEPLKNNKLGIEYLSNFKPFESGDQFLLCGSSNFNEVYNNYLKTNVPEIENIILF